MTNIRIPENVLLFCSVLYKNEEVRNRAVEILKEHFGGVFFCSECMAFDFTDYYKEEFGSPLSRILIAFEQLVPRESLPRIKHETNQIEKTLEEKGKRRVNLDPGILSQENICLATTKAYSHRIYLKEGIWADLTLIYKGNEYTSLPWTYPDYQSSKMRGVFKHLRYMYKEKIRCHEA